MWNICLLLNRKAKKKKWQTKQESEQKKMKEKESMIAHTHTQAHIYTYVTRELEKHFKNNSHMRWDLGRVPWIIEYLIKMVNILLRFSLSYAWSRLRLNSFRRPFLSSRFSSHFLSIIRFVLSVLLSFHLLFRLLFFFRFVGYWFTECNSDLSISFIRKIHKHFTVLDLNCLICVLAHTHTSVRELDAVIIRVYVKSDLLQIYLSFKCWIIVWWKYK